MRTQLTQELLVEPVPLRDLSPGGKAGARRSGRGIADRNVCEQATKWHSLEFKNSDGYTKKKKNLLT